MKLNIWRHNDERDKMNAPKHGHEKRHENRRQRGIGRDIAVYCEAEALPVIMSRFAERTRESEWAAPAWIDQSPRSRLGECQPRNAPSDHRPTNNEGRQDGTTSEPERSKGRQQATSKDWQRHHARTTSHAREQFPLRAQVRVVCGVRSLRFFVLNVECGRSRTRLKVAQEKEKLMPAASYLT